MPIFEFKCPECEKILEKIIFPSEKTGAICECGKELKEDNKVISVSNFTFGDERWMS